MKYEKNNSFMATILKVLPFTTFAQSTLIKNTSIGREGGWGYLSVSTEDSRLCLSHGNQVDVSNVIIHEKISVILDTKGVHCISALPTLGKGYITNG